MSNKQLLGILGISLLVIGVFLPFAHTIVGSINFISYGKEGYLILFVVLMSGYYIFKEKYREVMLSGVLALLVLVFDFIGFQMKLSEHKAKMLADLAGNPFSGIGKIALNNIYIDWGFAVMLIGAVLLILSKYLKTPSENDTIEDQEELHPEKSHTTYNNLAIKGENYTSPLSQKIHEPKNTIPVDNKKKKEIDTILTRIQTSEQESQEQHEGVSKIKQHKTQMRHLSRDDTDNESFLKKHGLKLVIVAVISFNVYLYFSKNQTTDDPRTTYTYETEVSNSFEDQMGWGKADVGAQIQSVNLHVGKMVNEYSDTFTHAVPVVELSVKNLGTEKLKSFGIYWEVKDIDNKRRVGGTGIASGSIDPDWTSKRHVLTLNTNSFAKLMEGNSPINFRMSIVVYVSLRGGEVVNLYDGILGPKELDALPIIEH